MNNPSVLKDFTSGGQLTMHSIRMLGQSARAAFWFCLIIFLLLIPILAWFEVPAYDCYLVFQAVYAYVKGVLQGEGATHWFLDPDQQSVAVPALDLIEYPETLSSLERCYQALNLAFFQALWSSVVSFFLICALFQIKGKWGRTHVALRGQLRVKPKQLAKLLKKQKKASDFSVAEVPLLKDTEVQHLLLTGTTGTGKTVCLTELMDQIRAKGQRAIVYDIEGSFIAHYYREGKDVLLNPLDKRCPSWNIWQEGHQASDFEAMASSLMPLHLAGSDPFWIHSARTIFSCAAQRLQIEGKQSMRELLVPLFSENLGSLFGLVKGSVAESLVSDKNEKTALSIKATLSTYCKALMYLHDEAPGLFSIGDWVRSEKDSWLFIATDAQKVEALKPLISVWLDVAAKSILSLTPSESRRLWFILDELPSLHRLPSFMNALARGRKYGSCFVAAIQDIHQLRAIYGRDEAETLISLFNTNICYRSKCPDSAAWMSKVMGGLEFMEKREGYSYGAHEARDAISIQQEHRREPVVRDAEFLELNDLEAFLKLPGAWPVTKLSFKPKERSENALPLIERELQELLLFDPKPSQSKPRRASASSNTSAQQQSTFAFDDKKLYTPKGGRKKAINRNDAHVAEVEL